VIVAQTGRGIIRSGWLGNRGVEIHSEDHACLQGRNDLISDITVMAGRIFSPGIRSDAIEYILAVREPPVYI
jgi:hypothetical protein